MKKKMKTLNILLLTGYLLVITTHMIENCFASQNKTDTIQNKTDTMQEIRLNKSSDNQMIISKIYIKIHDAGNQTKQLKKFAKTLIFLKEGKLFSLKKFYKSINALKASKIFKKIEVPDSDNISSNSKEISLNFHLTPFLRIRNIKITGGFPLFEWEILNTMTFQVGLAFIKSKIAEQEKAIIKLFKEQGYINPKVIISYKENIQNCDVTVFVNITKGKFYKIKEVLLKGNHSFSNTRLKLRTNSWYLPLMFVDGCRFVQKDIKEDVETLTNFYRKKGFADVVVTFHINHINQNNIILVYQITEGPLYQIEFKGNNLFWDFTLKKQLAPFKDGNNNGFGLKKSLQNIKNLYHNAGYEKVSIKTFKKNEIRDDNKILKLTITINEGIQFVVDTVQITGNKNIKTSLIQKQILTIPPGILNSGGFVPDIFKKDILAIKALYLKYGYMNTKITKELRWKEVKTEKQKKFVNIIINIDEGLATHVSTVTIKGLNKKETISIYKELKLKKNSVYQNNLIKNDKNIILTMIAEKGYPDAVVKENVIINNIKNSAKIIYDVQKGSFTKMGDIFYVGNFRTKDKILKKEMDLKKGEPFSLIKINESQRNIQNMNAIDSVTFQTIQLKEKIDKEKIDYVDVVADIEERKPYYFQASAGYNTEKLFYINTGIGDYNFWGLNKELSALVQISQIGYRGDITLNEQRFLGLKVDSLFNIFMEREEKLNLDFGTKSYGGSVGFQKQLNHNFSTTLNFTFENKELFQRENKPILSEDITLYDQRSIFVVTPILIYNSTDSFSRPKKGMRIRFSTDISHGLEKDLDDFFKYNIETRYYFTPIDQVTIALRGKYTHIELYGSNTTVPEDQLLFLGGTSTVRGFEENRLKTNADNDPIGGRTAILGNIEVRYDLGFNLELITFFDTGCVKDSKGDAGLNSFRSAVGVGIGYITPIGPLEIMYGWKLDKEEQESAGCFNFSIGYTF